jgi:type III secretion protein J
MSTLMRGLLPKTLGLMLCLLVAACGNQEVYGKLKENEANDMVAVLRTASIDATKEKQGDEWSVAVAPERFGRAIEVLRANGLPRAQYANLGTIFEKKGFVSSPTEERARMIFGLSQELSNTVSQIDGVVEARVHLAIPEQQPLSDKVRPSSAAVFIKYQPGYDLRSQTGAIKSLVTNSIEGLSYDKVSVVMFPAQSAPGTNAVAAAGLTKPALAFLPLVLGIAGIGFVVGRGKRRGRALPVALTTKDGTA